jgi:bacterioferritin
MNVPDLIGKLNEAISLELGATLQYNQYAQVILGLERRVWREFFEEQSNQALAHARRFAEKVVALGGTPTTQAEQVIETADLTEMLQNSLEVERRAVTLYTEALAIADDNAGYRSLLEAQIQEEMSDVEELEKYLNELQPTPAGMAIGMNLSWLAFWQPHWVYNDALRNWGSFGSAGPGTGEISLGPAGYPVALNGRLARANMAMDIGAHYPSGDYYVTYTGEGTVKINGTVRTSGQTHPITASDTPIVVEISALPNPSNPVRDLRLYFPKAGGGHYTGAEDHPFHDRFVELINPFRVLRLKDTGMIDHSNVEFWSHQTPDGWPLHGAGGKTTTDLSGTVTNAEIVGVGTRSWLWHGNSSWPIVARCTTSAPHGLKTAQRITVSASGFYTWEQPARVVVVSATQFEIEVPDSFATKTGSFPWYIVRQSGMSYQDMCRLCNLCQADLWVCIPWFADDSYVVNMAAAIKATLAASRKVYVELSNEVWNGIFTQYMAAESVQTTTVMQAYADRAKGKLNLFRTTFAADSRVVRVYAGQHGNPALCDLVLAEITPEDIDAFAIAPYMIPATPSPFTAQQLALNVLAAVNDPAWYSNIVQHKTKLATFAPEAELICYEGGQHAAFPTQDAVVQAAMVEPKMREAYEVCLQKAAEAGITVFCFFDLGEKVGSGKSFSHLPWMDSDPAQFPRYDVLVDAA